MNASDCAPARMPPVELTASADEPGMTANRVRQELREALGLTVPIQIVPGGTLPRFEMKARRFVVEP